MVDDMLSAVPSPEDAQPGTASGQQTGRLRRPSQQEMRNMLAGEA